MASDALTSLPAAMLAVAPILLELSLPEETLADCSTCPVSPPSGEPLTETQPFQRHLRCCTFHPAIPNFLLGRALARDGDIAAVVRRRIALRTGVTEHGIYPGREWTADYRARVHTHFGREESWLCPYWVGGELACGVWPERGAVCRTWFCRHTDGPRAARLWSAVRKLLVAIEGVLATACVEHGTPPPAPAPPEAVEAWYRWCARHVEGMDAGGVAAVRADERIRERIAAVAEAAGQVGGELPEILGPHVQRVTPTEDGFRLAGYSDLLQLDLRRDIFELLSRLDGETPWREALEQASAQVETPFLPDLVESLYRAGLLEERTEADRVEAGVTLRGVMLDGELLPAPESLEQGTPLVQVTEAGLVVDHH